jgi:hypothetical protein
MVACPDEGMGPCERMAVAPIARENSRRVAFLADGRGKAMLRRKRWMLPCEMQTQVFDTHWSLLSRKKDVMVVGMVAGIVVGDMDSAAKHQCSHP